MGFPVDRKCEVLNHKYDIATWLRPIIISGFLVKYLGIDYLI